MRRLRVMSNREKMLLYILAIVCIVGGGYNFLVFPAIGTYQEVLVEKLDASASRDEISIKVDQIGQIESYYEINEEKLEELEMYIGDNQSDEQLEMFIRGICIQNKVSINDMNIKGDTKEFLPQEAQYVMAKTLDLNVYGDLENVLKLLDALNKEKDTIIMNANFDFTKGAVDTFESAYDVDTEGVYKITLIKYMQELQEEMIQAEELVEE